MSGAAAEVVRVADAEAFGRAAAEEVIQCARAALAARGRFTLVRSGGSTPRRLYELLAEPPFREQIDWERVEVFWGDERALPPNHPHTALRPASSERVPEGRAPWQDTEAVRETRRWVVRNYVKKFQADRMTLTAPLLNRAATILFLVAGADKAPVLREVLEGPPHPERLPAQLIRPSAGRLIWVVDRAAPSRLAEGGRAAS